MSWVVVFTSADSGDCKNCVFGPYDSKEEAEQATIKLPSTDYDDYYWIRECVITPKEQLITWWTEQAV